MDCPICHKECYPEEKNAFLDCDVEDVLPGNPELELMRAICPKGHRFFVSKLDYEGLRVHKS